jgi:hypothetical protein
MRRETAGSEQLGAGIAGPTATATVNYFRAPGSPAVVPGDFGSTDANVAVALGIPAIAAGAVMYSNPHQLEEHAQASSVIPGIRQVISHWRFCSPRTESTGGATSMPPESIRNDRLQQAIAFRRDLGGPLQTRLDYSCEGYRVCSDPCVESCKGFASGDLVAPPGSTQTENVHQ